MNALTKFFYPCIGFWLIAAFPFASWATTKAPPISLKEAREGSTLTIVATPPESHHFNVDAPASLVAATIKLKPEPFEKQQAAFKLPAAVLHEITLSLFVCDDANTFCEKQVLNVKWDGKSLQTMPKSPSVRKRRSRSKSTSAAPAEMTEHGFIVNEPVKALDLAREHNKPLMIDFYGIWCPPCNEFDARVFSTPEFESATRGFVKLKLDADQKISWNLKSKYRVGGYPTILFATPQGDEISRVVGYRPKEVFLPIVADAYARKDMTLAQLKAKADAGDQSASERLGTIYLEQEKFSDAEKTLAGVKSPKGKQKYWEAKVQGLKAAGGEPYVAALESAIALFPDTPFGLELLSSLSRASSEKKNAALEKVVMVCEKLIRNPKLIKNEDYSVANLWQLKGDALKDLGRTEESKKAWLQSAKEFERQIHGPKDRGNPLEAAWAYEEAGKPEISEQFFLRLEKTFPNEFTYYYYHSRMLLDQGKFKEAREKAEKSYEFAYGDNRLRVADVLVRALKGEARTDEAKKLLSGVLKDIALPEDASVRTHRYVKTLRELEKTL